MFKAFQLIRPINLLLTAFCMYCVRSFIIIPILKNCKVEDGYLAPYLNNPFFSLLVLSVVFINAAGYIINDYCDVETDKINKPEKLIITKNISFKQASITYYCLNIAGILLGVIVALTIHSVRLATIHLLSVGLLWLYATQFKRLPLIGNIVVSMLSALVIVMPLFFEPIIFSENYQEFILMKQVLLRSGLVFSVFAFLISMIREIIKDLQDVEGDKKTGCNTLPVMLSTKSVKLIVSFFIALTIATLLYFQYHFFVHRKFYLLFNYWNLYCILLIQLPLILVAIRIWKAEKAQQYKVLSGIIKFAMFSGIASMFFIQQWFEQYF